jgi:hypothetical protein
MTTLTHLLTPGDTGWAWAAGFVARFAITAATLTVLANLPTLPRAAFWETGGRR